MGPRGGEIHCSSMVEDDDETEDYSVMTPRSEASCGSYVDSLAGSLVVSDASCFSDGEGGGCSIIVAAGRRKGGVASSCPSKKMSRSNSTETDLVSTFCNRDDGVSEEDSIRGLVSWCTQLTEEAGTARQKIADHEQNNRKTEALHAKMTAELEALKATKSPGSSGPSVKELEARLRGQWKPLGEARRTTASRVQANPGVSTSSSVALGSPGKASKSPGIPAASRSVGNVASSSSRLRNPSPPLLGSSSRTPSASAKGQAVSPRPPSASKGRGGTGRLAAKTGGAPSMMSPSSSAKSGPKGNGSMAGANSGSSSPTLHNRSRRREPPGFDRLSKGEAPRKSRKPSNEPRITRGGGGGVSGGRTLLQRHAATAGAVGGCSSQRPATIGSLGSGTSSQRIMAVASKTPENVAGGSHRRSNSLTPLVTPLITQRNVGSTAVGGVPPLGVSTCSTDGVSLERSGSTEEDSQGSPVSAGGGVVSAGSSVQLGSASPRPHMRAIIAVPEKQAVSPPPANTPRQRSTIAVLSTALATVSPATKHRMVSSSPVAGGSLASLPPARTGNVAPFSPATSGNNTPTPRASTAPTMVSVPVERPAAGVVPHVSQLQTPVLVSQSTKTTTAADVAHGNMMARMASAPSSAQKAPVASMSVPAGAPKPVVGLSTVAARVLPSPRSATRTLTVVSPVGGSPVVIPVQAGYPQSGNDSRSPEGRPGGTTCRGGFLAQHAKGAMTPQRGVGTPLLVGTQMNRHGSSTPRATGSFCGSPTR
eukprot:TRINITY_DN25686_c0_g1_i2.p1 TRINITY_DN25686_c0_g1~~TRINITY_DN25686_c0_g1_i2.p1  ORF type:complete len:763 (-),score=116.50 TRINITY_DN25686_c0_g1_i2:345-2633(-)